MRAVKEICGYSNNETKVQTSVKYSLNISNRKNAKFYCK